MSLMEKIISFDFASGQAGELEECVRSLSGGNSFVNDTIAIHSFISKHAWCVCLPPGTSLGAWLSSD